ncbi:hypothetical protein GDO78_017197 [Eleutherodactylus coqui]|uniref:RING-type E3 ubiquitin transferase n=1 Tax=Eleutherodactylus coqui TaxID=57060 RepID=A0A8J6JVF8_ELECQ|nr:hypothetical protein GDO78_017197 [Eleutherodactylus coqui]
MAAAAGSPGAAFECNICLETSREPVVSVCGHLYCWPCLHQWFETRPERQECPVCKAGISRENGIPGFTDTGFHMSFGIGAFPFGFFTTVFNTNDFQSAPRADNGLPQGRMFGLPDSLFLIIAAFFFLWLISV